MHEATSPLPSVFSSISDVAGAPRGGDVEAHHHLALEARGSASAPARSSPGWPPAGPGCSGRAPRGPRPPMSTSGAAVGDPARDLRVALAGRGSTLPPPEVPTSPMPAVRPAPPPARAAHRVRGGDAHAARAGQRRGDVARAGAAAEHVRERAAAAGRAEDLEQPLAGHRCCEHGLALGGVLRKVLLLPSFLTSFFSSACAVCSGAFCCSGSGGLGGRRTRAKRSGSSSSDRSLSSGLGLSMMQAAPAKWRNSEAARMPKNRWSMLRPQRALDVRRQLDARRLRRRGDELEEQRHLAERHLALGRLVERQHLDVAPLLHQPLDLQAGEVEVAAPVRTRPFIRSVKTSVYCPLRCSKTGKLEGSSLAGMTKVFFAVLPDGDRGRVADVPLLDDLPVADDSHAEDLGAARGRLGHGQGARAHGLERVLLHALLDLRYEALGLLQLVEVQVGAGKHVEGFRFLDSTLDGEGVELDDLLAAAARRGLARPGRSSGPASPPGPRARPPSGPPWCLRCARTATGRGERRAGHERW